MNVFPSSSFVLQALIGGAFFFSGVQSNDMFELIQVQKLFASGAEASDWFGWAMDADGTTAVVAVLNDDTNGEESGAVSVFEFDSAMSSWSLQATLLDNDGDAADFLGIDVAISGDTAVAGAEEKDATGALNDEGAVLIWDRTMGTSWGLTQTLFADTPEDGSAFGKAVDISGDWLAVGAPKDGMSNDGAVFMYQRSAGTFGMEQKIVPTTPETGEQFGLSVAIENELLVVGSKTARVIVFEYNSVNSMWEEQDTILDEGVSDDSGASLDVNEGIIVAGVPEDNVAMVFGQDYTAMPTTLSGTGRFGKSVAKNGDFLAIGSPDETNEQGRVRFYNDTDGMGNWSLVQTLSAEDNDMGDSFGYSVALVDESLLVGAYFDQETATEAGAVYAFVENPFSEPPSSSPSSVPSVSPSLQPSMSPSMVPELCFEADKCDLNRCVDHFTHRYWMNIEEDGGCRDRCVRKRKIIHRKDNGWNCGKCP